MAGAGNTAFDKNLLFATVALLTETFEEEECEDSEGKTGVVLSTLCRDDIPKQEGFVAGLGNYTRGQWVEFFRMGPGTAQQLVQEIGIYFRERAGRGRENVHLQGQMLMLLHFVAHRGKYGLCSEKFGVTRSCYHVCVNEMLDILVEHLLFKFVRWPNEECQKETADFFWEKYSFPGVIGTIDRTHITMTRPPGQYFPEDYFSMCKKIYTMLLQVKMFDTIIHKIYGPP